MSVRCLLTRLLVLGLLLALACALLPLPPALAATPAVRHAAPRTLGQISEYRIPKGYGGTWAITTGPDGNIWFTDNGPHAHNFIGRLTLHGPRRGQVNEYAIPVKGCYGAPPPGIVVGPDGNLWAIACFPLAVVQINPHTAHMIAYVFPYHDWSDGQPLTVGPDGNLWLLEYDNGTIDRFSLTDHTLTTFPLPGKYLLPYGLTTGPDGNLWYTDAGNGEAQLGRVNPTTGQVTTYPLPYNEDPEVIAPGPKGDPRLWFVAGEGALGWINPFTGQLGQVLTPNGQAGPGLSAGPDGTLWLADGGNRQGEVIGRATDSATILFTDYPIPTLGGLPEAITMGPDGNLWFTELYDGRYFGDKIGMVSTH